MLRSIVIPIVKRSACFAIRNYRRDGNRRPRDMAGIRIQQGILNNVDSLEDDPEVTYDADFTQLDQSYDEHEKEMAARKEQLKYHIIKRKHFKTEKQPNFLTWAEKEQIRYLHKERPDEWTPERLAGSFPAVEEVIKKILKAKWTPGNMQRIQKHDEGAKHNWQLFKSNQLKDLDPEVCEHLKKFSNRNFDHIKNAYIQTNNDQIKFQFPKPKTKEFLSIISSCKRITADSEQEKLADRKKPQIESNQSIEQDLVTGEHSNLSQIKLEKSLRSKTMTYQELIEKTGHANTAEQEEIHLSVSLPNEEIFLRDELQKENEFSQKEDSFDAHTVDESVGRMNSPPKHAAKYVESTRLVSSKNSEPINLSLADISSSKIVQKYEAKSVSLKFNAENSMPIRHKINIPDNLRRRGSVYKLYDCFYDDRGNFMYRVPGLTS